MAQKLGYFEEAGLDVSITAPSEPAAPIKLVAAGRSDLAISYEPEVVLAHEQGLDVVAIAAIVNRPLTSMIWLRKSGINGVAGSEREDDRDRRHPLPGRLPDDDPRPRRPHAARTSRRSTSASACCRRWSAAAPRRCSAGISNVEGVDLRERGNAPVDHPGRQARRPDLRRAGPGHQPQEARSRTGQVPPLHRGARTRHAGGDRKSRTKPPRRSSKRTTGSIRN